eukprot:1158046-Pelagomonas_calceolata.AAC.11
MTAVRGYSNTYAHTHVLQYTLTLQTGQALQQSHSTQAEYPAQKGKKLKSMTIKRRLRSTNSCHSLLPEVSYNILHAGWHDGVGAGARGAELGVGAHAGEAAREVGHLRKEAQHGGAEDA